MPSRTTSELMDLMLSRLLSLEAGCAGLQIVSEESIQKEQDGVIRDVFAVGQYRSRTEFYLGGRRDDLSDSFLPRVDGNGSTFMGLWFLSQTHQILSELLLSAPSAPYQSALTMFQQELLKSLMGNIESQLQVASELPKFFQGGAEDVLNCPEGTMGWWPLVGDMRLPALMPRFLRRFLPFRTKEGMANNSDGDIWSWCMAIDDTTPGILQYKGGEGSLNDPSQYASLLGSSFMEGAQAKAGVVLDDAAKALIAKVSPDGSARPIGTFYGGVEGDPYPERHPQRLSCAVMANILSSIPLVDEGLEENLEGIKEAIAFLQQATQMVLDGELEVFEYTYDYDTIPGCVFAYVARAHKRIIEIGREGFPHLLTPQLVEGIAKYLEKQALSLLALSDEALASPENAPAYASLIYCFNGMMNLQVDAVGLFKDELLEKCAQKLLIENPGVVDTPGTGPYPLFYLPGTSTQAWTTMSSVCFVLPPLIEAYALYIQRLVSQAAPL